MKYPVTVYGDPLLRKKAKEIKKDNETLNEIIENMWETMYFSDGVGLAAPQVGLPIRLFLVDASSGADEEPELEGFKKVFINPIILDETGEKWEYSEGCLSLPTIREDVERKSKVSIEYLNENFELIEEEYDGIKARIIQHEYDHLEGVLFTDHLNPLRKRLIRKKLQQISKGDVDLKYKMKFPPNKKLR